MGLKPVVCLAQWRDSSTRGACFETLSEQVAETVKLSTAGVHKHLDKLKRKLREKGENL